MKSLLSFLLGLIAGAALLLSAERLHLGSFFIPKEHQMQTALTGTWQGSASVAGYDVDFVLAVKSDGHTLSGTLSAGPVGDVPCDSVQVDPKGTVNFTVHVADKSATFTGKLATDLHSMNGDVNGSVGQGNWSLTKKS